MSYNLGTATGEIITTYNGKGVSQAEKDIAGLQKSTGGTKGAIQDVGSVAGKAGLAIAAGIGLAVNSAANFEERMSAVKAVSGASAGEMDQLSKKALQLGKDTSFSATEAATAMEELVKSGLSVDEVLNGAADATVALAAAGEVSLPEAATIASNAMNQFNLKAQDMPRVADLIAGAANASAIDVKEFGYSLQQVGAVANLAGASFDDTATAIALMGNAGIKGSDAGTSLKTMLSNLQPSTKKQTKLFRELGLITADGSNQFYDAQGNLKSFSQIAGTLQGALKGMTKAQKQAALETLFGSDAIRAAAIFSNEGAAGFNKMTAAMTKVKAADVAKTRLDNFKGSLEAFKGSLETAGIVIGQIFLPVLRQIVDAISKVLNAFLNLPAGVQKTIAIFLAAIGTALLITAAVVKIVFAIQKVIAVLKILRAAMAITWIAALGPIGLIILAIAAVIAIVVLLWKKSETFRNIVLGVWSAIKTAVSAVLNFFTGTLWPGLQAVWNGIIAGLQAVGNFFRAVWNGLGAIVSAVVGFIAKVISTYVAIWRKIITTVLGAVMKFWGMFWKTFGGVISAAFKLVVAIVQLGMKVVNLVIFSIVRALLTFWRAQWNLASSIIKAVWNAIRSVISTVAGAVRDVIVAVFSAVSRFVGTVWGAIRDTVSRAISAVLSVVSRVAGSVRDVVARVWGQVSEVTGRIWGALSGVVGGKLSAVLSKVREIVGKIRGVFSGAAGWLYNAGRDIIQGLLNGIESLINSVTSKLKSLTDLIPDVKGPPAKDKKLLQENGRLIMEGLGIGVDKGILPFLKKLEGIGPLIPNTITARTVGDVTPPTGLTPAASVAARTAPAPAAGRNTEIHLTTYNPVGKTSVEELSDAATRLSMLGVLD
jgi:TP901 family phage tail tape measure protein